MCRLPEEDKDIPPTELYFDVMILKTNKIKEKHGEELPVCEITKQDEMDIAKLNASFRTMYAK